MYIIYIYNIYLFMCVHKHRHTHTHTAWAHGLYGPWGKRDGLLVLRGSARLLPRRRLIWISCGFRAQGFDIES